MKRCPVTRLPVTCKPHWNSPHLAENYITKFSLIGSDVIYIEVETDCEVTMNHVDFDILHSVIDETNQTGIPVYTVVNLANIKGCSFTYKRDLVNLLYNAGPVFHLLAIYNVHPEMLLNIETLVAIAPEESTIVITGTYHEALMLIMGSKTGKLKQRPVESEKEQQYNACKKEFLAALARISWFNMFSHPITMPDSDSPFYPFFKSLKDLRNDLCEKEQLQQQELRRLMGDYEKKITEKNLLLQARQALSKKLQMEHEKSELAARVASKNMALTRLSTAVAKNRTKVARICSLVEQLNIEPAVKERITAACRDIVADGLYNNEQTALEITTADSEFLSDLQHRHPNLTKKELHISMLIKRHLSNAEIARSTGLTPRGVESLRYRMHKKLGLAKHQSIKNYLLDIAAATS